MLPSFMLVFRAILDGLDEGTFTEGHELDRKWRVPKEMIGQRLSQEQAKRLLAKFTTSALEQEASSYFTPYSFTPAPGLKVSRYCIIRTLVKAIVR